MAFLAFPRPGADAVAPGRGYNCLRGIGATNVLLDRPLGETALDVRGGRGPYDLRRIASYREFLREESASVSVWGQSGTFSASASYERASSSFEAESDLYVAVEAAFVSPAQVFKERILSDEALKLAEGGSYAQFVEGFGTHVVAGYVPGVALKGTLILRTEDRRQRQTVETKVTAAINGFASKGGGQVAFKEALSEIRGLTDTRLSVRRIGGVGAFPNDIDQLIADAIALPTLPADQRAILSLVLEEHSSALNWPTKQLDKMFEIRNALAAVSKINEYLLEGSVRKGDAKYISTHSTAFKSPEGENVKDWAEHVGAKLDRCIEKATSLRRDISDLHEAPPGDLGEVLGELPPVELSGIATVAKPRLAVLTLYKDADFRGARRRYAKSDAALGGQNDSVSSIKLSGRRGEYVAICYSDRNFGGRALTLTSPAELANLNGSGFQDGISSVALHRNR